MGEDKNLPDVDSASEDSNSTPPEPEVQEEVQEQTPRIRMRNKTPITSGIKENGAPVTVGNAAAAIQRTMMGALYEGSPDFEENNEGKLQFQFNGLRTNASSPPSPSVLYSNNVNIFRNP